MSADLPAVEADALPALEAGPCSARVPRRPGTPAPGRGRVEVAVVAGSSAIVGCSAAPPLHLFTPCARGRSASVVLATYGGGLVAGDAIDLAVDVGPEAIATISTQAETKVYRSEGSWAAQRMTVRIGAEAALAVVPEPTSCFAGARYRQHQRFELHPRASLLLHDSLTPGRSARGERWAFEACLLRNDVHVGGRLALRDALRLVQGEGASVGRRMGDFELLATVVAVGPALAEVAAAILAEVGGSAAEGRGEVLAAASPLRDGVHLRVAARTVESGLAFLHAQVAPAASVFGSQALRRRP